MFNIIVHTAQVRTQMRVLHASAHRCAANIPDASIPGLQDEKDTLSAVKLTASFPIFQPNLSVELHVNCTPPVTAPMMVRLAVAMVRPTLDDCEYAPSATLMTVLLVAIFKAEDSDVQGDVSEQVVLVGLPKRSTYSCC